MAVTVIVVGIPMFTKMLRILWEQCMEMTGQRPGVAYMKSLLWALSMFRLPEILSRRHRWFVPLYYDSFVAPIVAFVFAVVWSFN